MRELHCKRYLVTNYTSQWWIPKTPHLHWARKHKTGCVLVEKEKLYECITKEENPFLHEPQISKFWNKNGITSVKTDKYWKAPKSLFWLCGKSAYVMLPKNWAGSCTLGIIKPSFFLLPRTEKKHLGIPLYDELRRKRREILI